MTSQERRTDKDIDPLFINRWSPRAFDPDFRLNDNDIHTLFEASRWSPSCFNEQPWRFVYSLKQDPDFDRFLSLLVEGNQIWAQSASALCFIIAKKSFTKNGKLNRHSWFDSGAAWLSLALQAELKGLSAHAMAGIKTEEIPKNLGIPTDDYEVICAVALGRRGSKENLPENLRETESPNSRKSLDQILFKSYFEN